QGDAERDQQERSRSGRQQQRPIAGRQAAGHPIFFRFATDSANASASALALPYQTSSKRRVSAASVAPSSLDAGSSRRYSRGVRARSGRHAPLASRNATAHQ